MGLDMHLTRSTYIGGNYEHRKVSGSISISINGTPVAVDLKRIHTITEEVGYWRKANQIHKWFVDEIQGGVDECQEAKVSYEKLLELSELCKKVITDKTPDILPPQSGFFFGDTEADKYYYQDLQETIDIIGKLPDDGEYYYRSSW